MAGYGANPSSPVPVAKMNYRDLHEVTRMLDADHMWEQLGSRMNCTADMIALLDLRIRQKESPCEALFKWYGQRCHTTDDLFLILLKMNLRAATFLVDKGYVSPQYHEYLHKCQERVAAEMSTGTNRFSALTYPNRPTNSHLPKEIQGSNYNNFNIPCQNTEFVEKSKIKEMVAAVNVKRDPVQNTEYFTPVDKLVKKLDTMTMSSREEEMCAGAKSSPRHVQFENVPEESGEGGESVVCGGSRAASEVSDDRDGTGEQQDRNIDAERCDDDASVLTQRISYADIMENTDNFSEDKVIGSGAFGKVYRGTFWNTPVAIKRLDLIGRFGEERQSHAVGRELLMLSRYRHENIVVLYGCSTDGPYPCVIYEYMVNGSVEDRLQCKNDLPVLTYSQRSDIGRGAARGIQYLHTATPQLIHGDVKSANILLSRSLEAKLCDFGLCREGPKDGKTSTEVSRIRGTFAYLPPDYLRTKKLSPQLDTYSLGIVLLELVTGEKAYDAGRPKENEFLLQYAMNAISNHKILNLRDKRLIGRIHGVDEFLIRGLCKLSAQCTGRNRKSRPDMVTVLKRLEELHLQSQLMQEEPRGDADAAAGSISPLDMQKYHDLHKK